MKCETNLIIMIMIIIVMKPYDRAHLASGTHAEGEDVALLCQPLHQCHRQPRSASISTLSITSRQRAAALGCRDMWAHAAPHPPQHTRSYTHRCTTHRQTHARARACISYLRNIGCKCVVRNRDASCRTEHTPPLSQSVGCTTALPHPATS